jgi:hypothetical protein
MPLADARPIPRWGRDIKLQVLHLSWNMIVVKAKYPCFLLPAREHYVLATTSA